MEDPSDKKLSGSSYSATEGNEPQRLATQASLFRDMDEELMAIAISLLPEGSSFRVLDLGTGSGDIARDFLAQLPACEQVVAVDKDQASIDEARRAGEPSSVSFQVLDAEGPKASDDIERVFAKADCPWVVFSALALHHLASPTEVLRILKAKMPAGSVLVVRTIDDGLRIAYPDTAGRYRRITEIGEQLPGGADHEHGRKLQQQLYEAGFRRPNVISRAYATSNVDSDGRQRLFEVMLGYKVAPWERASVIKEVGDLAARNAAEVRALLAEIEKDFADESFFFSASLIGAVVAA